MPFINLQRLTFLALFHHVLGWMTAVSPSSRLVLARPSQARHAAVVTQQSTKTRLAMGLMDSLSNFLSNRQGDFVKLDSSDVAYGPGPLLIVYGIPAGIDNDEI